MSKVEQRQIQRSEGFCAPRQDLVARQRELGYQYCVQLRRRNRLLKANKTRQIDQNIITSVLDEEVERAVSIGINMLQNKISSENDMIEHFGRLRQFMCSKDLIVNLSPFGEPRFSNLALDTLLETSNRQLRLLLVIILANIAAFFSHLPKIVEQRDRTIALLGMLRSCYDEEFAEGILRLICNISYDSDDFAREIVSKGIISILKTSIPRQAQVPEILNQAMSLLWNIVASNPPSIERNLHQMNQIFEIWVKGSQTQVKYFLLIMEHLAGSGINVEEILRQEEYVSLLIGCLLSDTYLEIALKFFGSISHLSDEIVFLYINRNLLGQLKSILDQPYGHLFVINVMETLAGLATRSLGVATEIIRHEIFEVPLHHLLSDRASVKRSAAEALGHIILKLPDHEILNQITETFIHTLVRGLDNETDSITCKYIAEIIDRILTVENKTAVGGYQDFLLAWEASEKISEQTIQTENDELMEIFLRILGHLDDE